MHHKTFLFAVASFFVYAASFCHADSSERVRVGVILPLTGEFAAWGEGIRRGIDLSASDGGRLVFDYQDEGSCEAQKALSAFRKFNAAGIHLVIVGCLAGTKAILPIANEEKTLLLSAGLVDDSVFENAPRIINFATQLSTESRYLSKRVIERGFRRIAIIHWNDAFSEEFGSTLANALEASGARVVIKEGLDPKENDFRAVITRIKAKSPDALCFNVGQDQQAVLLRQMNQLGLLAATFSNYVFETPSVLALEKIAEAVEYTFPVNASDGTPEKEAFDKKFEAKFGLGAKPTANTYFVRDGIMLLERAIGTCKTDDTDCVAASFKAAKNFSGLSGEVSFQQDGSNDRPYGIKTVKNGAFTWLSR